MASSDAARYTLVILPSALEELENLPTLKLKRQVAKRIEALGANPFPQGYEKLSGYRDLYRLRQGMYRIIYEVVDHELRVVVVRVAHRAVVYR